MGLFSVSGSSKPWLSRPVRGIPLLVVLVVPFALQTLAIVTLANLLLLRQGQQAIRENSIHSVNETSAHLQAYLTEFLRVPHLVNQLNADSLRFNALPVQNPQQLTAYLEQQIIRFPGVSSIAINTPQGGETKVGQKSVDPRDTFSVSKTTASSSQIYPIWLGENEAPLLGLAAQLPVYDSESRLKAVFATDITLDPVSKYLSRLKSEKIGEVFILDRSGQLVSSSTPESLLLKRGQQVERRKATQSVYPLISETTEQIQASVASLAQIQTPQSFDLSDRNGNPVLVKVTPFQDGAGLDWLTVVVVPEGDILVDYQTNNPTPLWLSLVSLAASLGLSLLTARWIARPISKLAQVSRSVTLGEWDFPVEEDSQIAETEILISSFNQMAYGIQQSLDQVKTALQESNEKFTQVYQLSPDAISITSLVTDRYLDVNDQFLAITGYQRQQVIGHTLAELNLTVYPEQLDQIRQMIAANIAIRNFEFTARNRTGEIRTFLLSANVLELEGQSCLLTVAKDITERTQAEAAAQLVQQQLNFHIANSPMGTIVWGSNFEVQRWSEQAEQIFGWRSSEMLGKTIDETGLVFETDREYVMQEVNKTLAQRESKNICKNRNYTKDGRVLECEWYNSILYDAEGNIASVLSQVQDVTDRNCLERELNASRSRLNDVLDRSTASITCFRVWPDGTRQYEFISSGFERVFGYSRDDVMANPELWALHLQANNQESVLTQVMQAIFAEQRITVEYPFYTREGEIHWIEDRITARREAETDSWVGISVAIDITEWQQAETALKQSEQRFKSAFDNTAVGMAIVALDGQFLEVNTALCQMLGYTRAEIEQLTFQSITHPEDLMTNLWCRDACLKGDISNYDLSKRYFHRDGQTIWGYISVSLIRDSQDRPLYFVTHVQDITTQKMAEVALAERHSILYDS